MTKRFHGSDMSVNSDHFLPVLKRLDECIAYVSSNPQYADASVYLLKFRNLQSRALSLVRSHVLAVLRHASAQVKEAVREQCGPSGVIPEGAATSLLYVRFRAAAPELKPLMEEMAARGGKEEYQQLMADCHALYCAERLALVAGVVQDHIHAYGSEQNLPSLTRLGCSYLIQLSQLEHQLVDHFFPTSSVETSNLAPLMDPLCIILYDILRPMLITETDMDVLCELVDILKLEVLEEQLGRRGEAAAGLTPTVVRTLADVQERLTFVSQTFLNEEVRLYQPTPDDLDYPNKLIRIAEADDSVSSRGMYASWYRPVEQTLSCLSKLYRCVDAHIFMGIAQEAVATCADAIQNASRLVARKSGGIDGQLFLIKHLLILREQIAPFDVDFAVTYKDLDFSHMRDHMARIFRGELSLFALNSHNALLALLAQGGPRVMENMVDSKKELEKHLKLTCEAYIMSVTKLVVEPMLSFITKVTAVRVASSSATGKPRSLREQAFASPAKLTEMVDKVRDALKGALPEVLSKMKLYLHSPSTRSILFKPIKTNILEARQQIASLLAEEYGPEDREAVQLMTADEIIAQLDKLGC
eukprot:jgi/Mesvir1/4268/Mv22228-RA.2